MENVVSIEQTQNTHLDSRSETTNITHVIQQSNTYHDLEQKEIFDEKMHEAENEKRELLSQIYTLQEDLKTEIQKKVQAQVLLSKRDKEIQRHQITVDSLKEDIQSLKSDLETSKSQYTRYEIFTVLALL